MEKVNSNKKDILIKLKNTLDDDIPDEITFDNNKILQIKSLIKDCIYILENQENTKDKITIPLEEYKELLIIKGKSDILYEEHQNRTEILKK